MNARFVLFIDSDPMELSDGTTLVHTVTRTDVLSSFLAGPAFKKYVEGHIVDIEFGLLDYVYNKCMAESEEVRIKAEEVIAKRLIDEAASKAAEAAKIESEKIQMNAKQKDESVNVNTPPTQVGLGLSSPQNA